MTMANKNDDCRNVFVRKLPLTATSKELREAFDPYGLIRECNIIVDKVTGESKGFGFVKFELVESALKAVSARVYIGSAELGLSIANPNAKRRNKDTKSSFVGSSSNPMGERKLFVRYIPYDVTETELKPLFEVYVHDILNS